MEGKASRFIVICIAVICVALLAMRLSRTREPMLQTEIADQKAVPAELFYVGSKYDKIYQKPSCSEVAGINTDEFITFTSVKQAKRKGYRPCEK